MKTQILFLMGLIFLSVFVIAHSEDTFTEAEKIIMQKIPCENLTNEQLEIVGDYYMEQMHPGELHEAMDEMMGGEGSESLKENHINIALSFYCGKHQEFSSGMMNIMMGRDSYYGYGMMEGYYYRANPLLFLFNAILIIILILFIIWILKKILENKKRGKRK
ncbi:MAG: hypothetical protein WDZ77_03030 [Candidatus Pacearchaeota archaeon]